MTRNNPLRFALLVAAVSLAACGSMSPMGKEKMTQTSFGATLSASAEVPANSSTGGGSMTGTLNDETKVLTWRVTYSGLSGPATAGHIHGPAMAGANAGVVVPFATTASPIEGSATLTAAQIADLRAGLWYVNLHTAANPGGEVRGQVLVK